MLQLSSESSCIGSGVPTSSKSLCGDKISTSSFMRFDEELRERMSWWRRAVITCLFADKGLSRDLCKGRDPAGRKIFVLWRNQGGTTMSHIPGVLPALGSEVNQVLKLEQRRLDQFFGSVPFHSIPAVF